MCKTNHRFNREIHYHYSVRIQNEIIGAWCQIHKKKYLDTNHFHPSHIMPYAYERHKETSIRRWLEPKQDKERILTDREQKFWKENIQKLTPELKEKMKEKLVFMKKNWSGMWNENYRSGRHRFDVGSSLNRTRRES